MNASVAAPVTSAVPPEIALDLEKQGVAPGSYDFTPLTGFRKLIARRMTESVHAAPHFSVDMKIELDALQILREKLNVGADTRVSLNDLMIKATALALIHAPGVNVSYTDAGILTHHHADIGFAVAMEGGLVTPIVRSAEAKTPYVIAAETIDLVARGRIKRLKPDEYNGGSFCLSNLGMFGVSRFNAIINRPQAAILSIGTGERAFVLDGTEPRVATVMTATLTSDHRVIDGAVAARWLGMLKELIEHPDALVAG